jgi:hypothetical protein
MPEINVPGTAVNLWDWLSRWTDENGGVHGYVVHHHRDNLRVLSPDTWTQSASILGCLGLYRASGELSWLGNATRLGDYLVGSYIRSMHVFANSNHEHKPLGKPEVIGNALPSYALLQLATEKQKAGGNSASYLEVAEDNINGYLLAGWNEDVGAVASLDQGRNHFVLNMNGFVAMALASWSKVKGDGSEAASRARRICEFISKNQIRDGPNSGGFPYRAGTTTFVTLYSVMTAYSLLRVSRELGFGGAGTAEAALGQARGLLDPKLGLVAHQGAGSPPYWLPDTALLYLASKQLAESEGREDSLVDLSKLLSMQYRSGGFPLSVGFSDLFDRNLIPPRMELRRWRDALPTPNWNSWLFWHLSESLRHPTKLPAPSTSYPHNIVTSKEESEGPYTITDEGSRVRITDAQESDVAIFDKRREVAILCRIQERDEGFRMRKRLDRYPPLLRKGILALAGAF